MKILGIETSCDETAAAIVTDKKEILSNILHSQIKEHTPYGGVVPEIASRAHISFIENIINQAMDESGCSFADLDAIAVTGGPGLIGGVIVGVMVAKGIASAAKKPFIAVNHLEGHALTARLTDNVEFPFLLLLVSGGHCQILICEGVGKYKLLGQTLDDAVGESFDKVAKMLGLGYPGGPIIEKLAKDGDPNAFELPKPLIDRPGCDFSFSGLKTAIFRTIEKEQQKTNNQELTTNLSASFQATVSVILNQKVKNAINTYLDIHPSGKTLVVAGGVAANKFLINGLSEIAASEGINLVSPPVKLCTDNAAMIAWAGIERLQLGQEDSLDFEPRARWPLFDD